MSSNNSEVSLFSLEILVLHADIGLGQQISDTLKNHGFQSVTLLHRVRDALSVLRKQAFAAVICDTELDEMDGWRMSRLLRSGAMRCAAMTPIVLTTSTWCERIAEVTAREYGINALVHMGDIASLPSMLVTILRDNTQTVKPALLVIEDEEDTADLVKLTLSQRFEVDIAEDGEQGLAMWRKRGHALVLLDVMLPKLDGSEVLHAIMSDKPDQAVVIMTAHAPVDQAEQLLINGACDFISKPFRPEHLRNVVDLALRRNDYMVSNQQFADRVRSLAEREAAYREISETHKHLLNNLQTVVMELDEQFNIVFLNNAWSSLLGYDVKQCLNAPFKQFLAYQDERKFKSIEGRFQSVLRGIKDSCELEVVLNDADKRQRWANLRVTHAADSKAQHGLIICLDDISRRKQAQQQLEFLAMHDALTGLYNRSYFENVLQELSYETQFSSQQHGLMYIDLDYFKVVNDSLGHHRGDQVLKQLSKVIEKQIRESDILCRFGGDEFAVLLYDLNSIDLLATAEKIQHEISHFVYTIGTQAIHLGCSIGISIIDGNARKTDDYLIQADIALFVAKHRGRNNVHVYNPQDGESDELRRNVDWARKIRLAMQQDRLILHFQPIMHIATGKIAYYEALVRMRDEDASLIMPDQFIRALESTGDMGLLDRWVVKQAIKLLSESPQLNKVAINLSAQAFQDKNLLPVIREALAGTAIDGSRVAFELTESASLVDLSATQDIIDELHQLGCHFSVDDFGSGFSSFAYLKDLNADFIKLDGSFIHNLDHDEINRALVCSMIDVVKMLGRKTVAEFVESRAVLDFLRDNDVDYAQGYYIGHPLAVDDIEQRDFYDEPLSVS